jgi:cytochrome c
MASAQVQAYTDGQLKWIIDNGIFPSGMPASKGTLSDEESWQIVLYLRDLPRAGSLGDPKAYSGDEYKPDEAASNQGKSN